MLLEDFLPPEASHSSHLGKLVSPPYVGTSDVPTPLVQEAFWSQRWILHWMTGNIVLATKYHSFPIVKILQQKADVAYKQQRHTQSATQALKPQQP